MMLKDNLKNVAHLRRVRDCLVRGVWDCLAFSSYPSLLGAGRSPGISDADPPVSRMDSREGMEFMVKGWILLPAPLGTPGGLSRSLPPAVPPGVRPTADHTSVWTPRDVIFLHTLT